MRRRRAQAVTAMMLSRYVEVGDVLGDSNGDRFVVVERLTRDCVRVREFTRWERFKAWVKGWWSWLTG